MKTVLRPWSVAALCAALFLPSLAATPAHAAQSRTVTVTGTSTATVERTEAQIAYTVTVVSPSARDAYNSMWAKSSDIRQQLIKQKLVTGSKISTTSLGLRPEYSYDGSAPRIIGYRASLQNSIVVDVDRAGSLIDTVVDAGGDDVIIDQVSFRPANLSALNKSLRKAAIADAKETAVELATAAGAKVGKVRSITVVSTPQIVRPPLFASDVARVAELDPGTEKVDYSVNVVYELI